MKRYYLGIGVLTCFGIGMALYLLHVPHLLLGRYLSPTDNYLQPADVIVVASGSDDRLEHAIKLYKAGFAPKLIMTGAAHQGPVSDAMAMKNLALLAGVPEDAVLLDENARDTYENALFAKNIGLEQGFRSFILVTSPYHQRRFYETFLRLCPKTTCRLQNSPSTTSSWYANSWWQSKTNQEHTYSEAGKVLFAKLSGNYHR